MTTEDRRSVIDRRRLTTADDEMTGCRSVETENDADDRRPTPTPTPTSVVVNVVPLPVARFLYFFSGVLFRRIYGRRPKFPLLRFYRVLLGFIGFYWVLKGIHHVLVGYRVLLGFTGFYWVFKGFTMFWWVFLNSFARF